MGKIGATADIRKTFLPISLDDHDRDYLRFIWWKDGDPEKEMRTLSDPESSSCDAFSSKVARKYPSQGALSAMLIRKLKTGLPNHRHPEDFCRLRCQ
ncbi:hypothetical protein TNCT_160711 [Trichonephila clavata]|uniref:Uncharacterized protein n=1 Tax=Trichonephila clavata TaxID=2740835 RepID=A0A8X6LGK7_TRICU|nr:hypothetical protein TNCT_160711 [Trichonephila clavata]